MKTLAQIAIACAIKGNWKKAIEINNQLLEDDLEDIEALNRLTKAHYELGEIKNALEANTKVLKISPHNPIANKTAQKLKNIKSAVKSPRTGVSVRAFIEEPGKTKIVQLICLSSNENLIALDAGDKVKLNPHGHRVSVATDDGKYVGRLPDDISARLRELINLGNEYVVYVKAVKDSKVKVLIREIKRSPKISNIPSFTSEKIDFIAFNEK